MIKIAENLKLLRKEKKMSQEELAELLGVTSQSISKWELGINFPDLTLLPKIANIFKISIDELLGTQPISSINSIYIQMKALIDEAKTIAEKQELAYKLALLATTCQNNESESAERVVKGKKYLNMSMFQNDGGITVKGNNTVFICSFNDFPKYDLNTIRKIHKYLSSINKINTLEVLFGLFRMTLENGIRKSFTIPEIVDYTGIEENKVWSAFNDLDISVSYLKDGKEAWYLSCVNEVPVLMNLLIPYIMDFHSGDQ